MYIRCPQPATSSSPRVTSTHQYADVAAGLGLLLVEGRTKLAYRRKLPVVDGDGLVVQAGEARVLPIV